jgi:toxin-antitoxin system PIN domain toxin
MIAVDTTLLVYAHRADAPLHEIASDCIRGLAEGVRWAIPWPCLYELAAIVTHPRIWRPPSTTAQVIDQIEAWLASPSLAVLAETPDAWLALRELLVAGKVSGPAIHDARIAALCLQHGVTELWSCDRDFSRFRQLRVTNPLLPTRASERRGRLWGFHAPPRGDRSRHHRRSHAAK